MAKKQASDVKRGVAITPLEEDVMKIIAHASGMKLGTVMRLLMAQGLAEWVRSGRVVDTEWLSPTEVARAAARKIKADKQLAAALSYLAEQADKADGEDRLL